MTSYKGYTKLTKEEVQYILDNKDKKTTKEMADWIGCHISAITYRLRNMGIKKKQFSIWSISRKAELLELRKKGKTLQELAERYNVSKRAVGAQLTIMRKEGYNVPSFSDFVNIRKNVKGKAT